MRARWLGGGGVCAHDVRRLAMVDDSIPPPPPCPPSLHIHFHLPDVPYDGLTALGTLVFNAHPF